jgi:signal transduction histidine kinase
VADNGLGMSPEVQTHLFEPFFTTKPGTKGTGLGLSTVYRIVRESRGHIIVETEPNKGTTFEIFLPRESP